MTSSIWSTAFSALQGSQAGIALTSQNVEGQSTVGYTKRNLATSIAAFLPNGGATLGSGISIAGFTRDWSSMLQQQRVQQVGVTAYHGTIATGLAGLDAQVVDSSIGLDTPVNNFFNSLAALARNPADAASLDAVKASGTVLMSAAQYFQNSLATVQSDARSALQANVQDLNLIGEELAQINVNIANSQSQQGGGVEPAVLDRRDALLMRAGSLIGGNLGVDASGQAYVFVDGQPLVNGENSGHLQAVPDDASPSAPIKFSMRFGEPGMAAPPVLAALHTNGLQGVIGAQLKLAADPSIVLQPNGSPDSKLASFLDLFSAASGILPSGANSVMTALTQLASFNKGDAATSLTQLDATLQSLALQSNSADKATGASALQTNLLAGWRGFISNVGAQVSVHLSGKTASAAVDKKLSDEFQSQSGVNLDEEAANLLKYQQSYTAASKILQANAAMLDGLMAVVGR